MHALRYTQRITHTRTCALPLVMKTTRMAHLSLAPYKEIVTVVQIQMPFHAVGRSFRLSGGSYAPDNVYTLTELVIERG